MRNSKTSLGTFVAIPVALIVLAAFAISIAAVTENLHFISATNQILGLVSSVRTLAASQPNFVQNQGEDIWGDVDHPGDTTPAATHQNPWHGGVRAVSLSSKSMRIENDLPTHDCRRLALYFLELQPAELGIVSMEAQAVNENVWKPIYPSQAPSDRQTLRACGNAHYSRLAIIFKIR